MAVIVFRLPEGDGVIQRGHGNQLPASALRAHIVARRG